VLHRYRGEIKTIHNLSKKVALCNLFCYNLSRGFLGLSVEFEIQQSRASSEGIGEADFVIIKGSEYNTKNKEYYYGFYIRGHRG